MWFPRLIAFVASRLNALYGLGTCSYADASGMAYEEFSAWCAFLNHADFHRDDAAEQSHHDDLMMAAALAARS